jgi:hypothetical protein
MRSLRITRSWVRTAGYGMLLWVAVWFGMVVFFASLGARQDGRLMLMLALPGIGMAYAAVTRFLNRTVIDVTVHADKR